MAQKKANQCKATTRSGVPCQRKAGDTGYCSLHDPAKQRQQAEKRKRKKNRQDRLYELIDMVINTSQAKGWHAYLKSVDEDEWRFASLSVNRREGYEEITALVEISSNSKISVSAERTSFHGYGIDSLRRAFRDGLSSIPWVKPLDDKAKEEKADLLEALYRLLQRFDILVRQLNSRHGGRQPLQINDEYDVQYLLHALLRGLFDDVRAEEWSPSYAGASSRLDFLLKDEKVVIETKVASASLKDKQIGEQLIVDIQRYQAHPD